MKYKLLKNKVTGERIILNTVTREKISEIDNPEKYKKTRKLAINNLYRKERNDVYKDLGLIRVKSDFGKIYYE